MSLRTHDNASELDRDDLAYQLSLSEFLRTTMVECGELAMGEEDPYIVELFARFGRLIGAVTVAQWRDDGRTWHENNTWCRWGAHPSAKDDHHFDLTDHLPKISSTVTEPVIVSDDFLDINGLPTSSYPEHRQFMIVPAMKGGTARCFVVITREKERPWLPYEVDACSAMVQVIFKTRERLIVEAQLAACFYDAPLGITLRSLDGTLIDCNEAFVDFLGRKDERELLRSGGVELLATEHVTDDMLLALANPPVDGYRDLELPYRHGSGGVVWGRLSVASIQCQDVRLWLTHVQDVTALRAEQELTAARAVRDPLTGLANRHLLLDRLRDDLSKRPIDLSSAANAIVLFDLNGFKEVNDTRGHHAGDELLIEFGHRLQKGLRPEDIVVRYGGDEFVVVIAGPLTIDIAQQRAEELRRRLNEPIVLGDDQIRVSAAMGVALGNSGMSPDDVLRLADAAMYEDKRGMQARS